MARITGVELQDKWKIRYALTKIKGVGDSLSDKILGSLGINPDKKVSELTPEEISSIAKKLEEFPTEGELVKMWAGDRDKKWGEVLCFFFQAEDGIRDKLVTGVQTCALPI